MSTRKSITLKLEAADYERLEEAARGLGVTPGVLAGDYVRTSLNGVETDKERRRRVGIAALDRLAELTADLPPVDALRIAQESREELERRPYL